MRSDTGELPPDIRRLLDAERAAPLPAGVAARMEAKIARRLQDEPDPRPAFRARLRALWTILPGWAVPLAAFGLGASVGVGAHSVWTADVPGMARHRPLPPEPTELPSHEMAPAPIPVPPSDSTAASPGDLGGKGPGALEGKTPPKAAPIAAWSDALDGERALIERARTALYRGSNETALRYLDDYARSFPHGQLAEESEALWIQSAFGAAKYQAARERAEAFARKYPHSLMLPAIEEVLRGVSD